MQPFVIRQVEQVSKPRGALWYQAILPQKSRIPRPSTHPLHFLESRRPEPQPVGVSSRTSRCCDHTSERSLPYSGFRMEHSRGSSGDPFLLTFVRKEASLAALPPASAPPTQNRLFKKPGRRIHASDAHWDLTPISQNAPAVLDASELWKTVATLQQSE